ncbi:MAG: helix-turn-helix transcriptional regulator [Saprospiraceae bacterium]
MTKVTKKKFKFIVEKTRTGFSAYSDKLPVFTVGGSISELNTNILEAINFYFEEDEVQVSNLNISLEFDLKQFFEYYRVINAKFLAERIGMNETLLSQYVKGRKKPSKKQIDKIMYGINEIGIELSELSMVIRDPER